MAVADQQLEFAAGLTATAEQLRKAGEMMLDCAKLASQYANAVGGGSLKAIASSADAAEPATNGKRKRVVKKKDPNAPKRPASSYLMFQNEIRKELKEKFPNLSHAELIDLIKTQWKDLPEAKRQKYSDQVVKDKERYVAEKSAYDARSPEEVARADAKAAAEAALKKTRQRKLKIEKVLTPATVAPVTDEEAPRTSEGEEDEEEDDDDDEEEEAKPQRAAAPARPASSSSEDEESDDDDDEEEEEEPAPKKAKVVSKPVSKPVPVVSKLAPVKEKKKSKA